MWSAYLCASTMIVFSEPILVGFAGRLRKWLGDAAEDAPDLVELALRDLCTTAPSDTERAMAMLSTQAADRVTARLVELLDGSNALVARRAALVLFERQDPVSLQALFRYFAKHASVPARAG